MDKSSRHNHKGKENSKQEQLDQFREKNTGPGKELTDETGKKITGKLSNSFYDAF